MKYKEETITKVSDLFAKGFNSVEIGKELGLHEVTVRNIKRILKERNTNKLK